MARLYIEGLEWDDDNETHIARHGITPDTVASMIERQNWIEVRNKTVHSSQRRRLIGRDSGVALVTVVLDPTQTRGIWRTVTGWWSSKAEATLYAKGKGI